MFACASSGNILATALAETLVPEVNMVTVGTMVAEVTIGYYSRNYGF